MTPPDPRFARHRTAVAELATDFPRVHAALHPGKNPPQIDGWEAMTCRTAQAGGEPAVVATLYGPTGAGKSTLFRLLTGVPVPVTARKQTSFAAVVAAPPRLADAARLAERFPGFALEALGPADLGRLAREENRGRIFFVPAEALGEPARPLLLADVPDFDTVHTENRDTCRRMLQRAEVVVFVASAGKYKNAETVRQLAECCGLAATLVFVVTKAERPEAAAEIWRDVRENLVGRPAFRARRADGRTGGRGPTSCGTARRTSVCGPTFRHSTASDRWSGPPPSWTRCAGWGRTPS